MHEDPLPASELHCILTFPHVVCHVILSHTLSLGQCQDLDGTMSGLQSYLNKALCPACNPV